MLDIDKINNVAVADISKLDSITFADGQKVNNQDVSLVTDARVLIEAQTFTDESTVSFDSLGGVATWLICSNSLISTLITTMFSSGSHQMCRTITSGQISWR